MVRVVGVVGTVQVEGGVVLAGVILLVSKSAEGELGSRQACSSSLRQGYFYM